MRRFNPFKVSFIKIYPTVGSFLFGVVVFLTACAPPPPQTSCFFVQNKQKQRVSWGHRLPVTMYLNDNVPEEYKSAIVSAAQAWNSATGHHLFNILEGDSSQWPSSNRRSVIYWKTDWEDDASHEQARATISWTGDQITDADIEINAKDHVFFTSSDDEIYVSSSTEHIHLESLLIHEFGHALGLMHNDDADSTMQKSLSGQVKRDEIKAVDLENLKCEYNI